MKKPFLAAMILLFALDACGAARRSSFNPFNWFGSSKSEPRTEQAATVAKKDADPRQLIAQVTDLAVLKTSDGAIIRATGLPPTQGYWAADLVAENDGKPVKGVLTYRFVVRPPDTPSPASTVQSREITAASFVDSFDMASVRKVVVIGAENTRTSGR
ncbi:hypothetical protein FGG78_22515 [Thioclava sp. BHET1]|nr:hypothetical protein FGG78_22515 [Thioclava sp. BHET1]